MRIVLPMAGYGTRLRPHTWSKPKPLVSMAGKPMLGHVLDMFAPVPSIDEVVFIVGYLGEQIKTYVDQAYPHLKARYVEQRELVGQSHAVWLAREGLVGPMLLVFVDTIIETNLALLGSEKLDAVAWVREVPDPRRFGVAKVGSAGLVERLVEKPQDMSNNLAVIGFYYFKEAQALLAAIEEQMQRGIKLKGEYYLVDAINLMLDKGLGMRAQAVDAWVDCGTPEAVLETNRYLLSSGRDNTEECLKRQQVVINPPVYIHPNAVVHGSTIGPYASIAANCVVKHSTIKDSTVDEGTEITDSVLVDSLIGRGAYVGRFQGSLNIGDCSRVEAPEPQVDS